MMYKQEILADTQRGIDSILAIALGAFLSPNSVACGVRVWLDDKDIVVGE